MMMLVMTGCSNERTGRAELTISAAVSLKNSLDELKIIFQNENPDLKLHLNYGSSGSLYKQIVQGAPVDVLISADFVHVGDLVNNNLVNDDEYVKVLVNALVLIAKRNDISSFSDLSSSEVTSVAIGHPETVPAGKYAKASLTEQQIWGKIESKVVYAKDVRQVLTYVETGQIDAGVVYKTDAILSDKVRIVEVFESHNTSADCVSSSSDGRQQPQGRSKCFFEILTGEKGSGRIREIRLYSGSTRLNGYRIFY